MQDILVQIAHNWVLFAYSYYFKWDGHHYKPCPIQHQNKPARESNIRGRLGDWWIKWHS